jgi:hypothetical protein
MCGGGGFLAPLAAVATAVFAPELLPALASSGGAGYGLAAGAEALDASLIGLGSGAGIAGSGSVFEGLAAGAAGGAAGAAAAGGGGTTAPAATGPGGMSFGQAAMLSAGSQVLGSLLAPKPEGTVAGAGSITQPVTPMPVAPGAKERARAEQDMMKRRTMGRGYTETLVDKLG